MSGPEEFTLTPATRSRVPVLVGLIGESASGKTYSALRLGTGMVRVFGGKLAGIDTEGNRMLHYAWDPEKRKGFHFHHMPFAAPFGPLRYLAALQACKAQGATVVIVDSMSHEHEGTGGVLDMHESELQRIAGDNYDKRKKMNGTAWIRPKAERRALINGLLQLGISAVFCFRAQEKMDWGKREEASEIGEGGGLKKLGVQPIAGKAFVWEMTARALLMPGCDGVPEWNPKIEAERNLVKRPEQFRELFERYKGKPIDEQLGEEMARWAMGPSSSASTPAPTTAPRGDLASSLAACTDVDAWLAENAAELAKLNPKSRAAADKMIAKKRAELAGRDKGVDSTSIGGPPEEYTPT